MIDKKDPNLKHYFRLAIEEEFIESMKMHSIVKNSPPLTVWEKGESEDDAEIYEVIEYFSDLKKRPFPNHDRNLNLVRCYKFPKIF